MQLDRFCVPVGEDVPVDSDGFLLSLPGRYRLPSVVPLAEACAASAVLLGEAGIGKSHALSAVLEAGHNGPGRKVCVRVDLGGVRSWEDLTRKARPVLSRLAPAVSSQGSGPSEEETASEYLLLLDGVDECQATGKELAGWFTDLADTYDCRQLQVLIACRSMAYTDTLRQAVATAFGITDARTYTLAPLRMDDLAAAAAAKGADPQRFIEAVKAAGAQTLARTPLTLDLLLDTFLQHSALPASRADLYAFALPHAVMHQGKDRAPQELAGSRTQRFATAARLACYCLLTGADGITTSLHHPDSSRALLPVDTFLGTREGTTGESFIIERPLLESVLHSALFSSRGPAAAGPAHASIAAYLTARHLCDHRIPREQLQGLLVHRGEVGEPGIPTDLHELAAWLIALRPDLGPWLIGTDPQAIASYSSYIDDPQCTRLIVDGLLRTARHNPSRSGLFWRHATPLHHPGLTEQLGQALDDAVSRPLHGTYELELILTLIAENEVEDLLPAVASLAADTQRPPTLRRLAAQCADILDQDRAATLLKPILAELAEHPEHDPDDDLRGAVLGACRPWLTTDELISALTPPRTDRSPYTSFCQKLPALLTDEQVAPLLKWASTRVMDLDSPWAGWSDASAMAQGLLDRALSGPAAEARIPAVAAWLRPYLRTYPQLAVPAPLCAPLDDPGDPHTRHLRRTLAHHLITVARDSEDAFQLAEGWDTSPPRPIHWRWESSIGREREQRTSLLDAADLAWLVELEKSLSDIQAPHAWPALQHVWAMVKTTDAGQDTAWATRHTRVWPQVFAHDFDAIPIDSPYAQQLRIRQERLQARSRPWEGQAEYIATTCALLTQAASGDDDSFVTLCINLQRDPKTGRFPNADFDSDLLSLPGTAILANGHEKQLLSAARRFVTESRPGDDSWIGTHNVPWRSWAAIFAFTALLDDGQALSTLTPSQWRTWAPTLVAFPLTSTAAQHSSPRRRLLEKCLPHAPRELETTYDALVRASYATEEAQSTLDLISTIWTPQLEARLLETLTDLTTQAHDNTTGPAGHEVLAMVLAHILEQGSAQSRAQALERFGAPLRETSPARDELLDTAYLRVFLIKTPHEIWPTAEHRLRTDPTALESVCDAFLSAGSTRAWLAELPTPALGDIARILLNHYPLTASPDTPPHKHSTVVLDHLASRGTSEAIHILRALATDWPQDGILRTLVQEAEQAHRELSWIRPTPNELDELIQDPRRRLVKDGTDLLDLVLVLLQRIQEDLTQGTLPAAILWNETELETVDGRKTRQRLRFPKDENLVSDYLAHALRRDLAEGGILINREVQVYRNIKGAGDRIDLLLQAPTAAHAQTAPRRPDEPVAQVAIEVKGNWHDKIETAMETQLADDYLAALRTRNGLYLIAFFPNDQWTAKERKQPAAGQTRANLQEFYDAQAAQLSERRSLDIRAFVLDCTLRSPAQRNT
ncbi:NACHT domain-containing protein [Streptomyces longwoodensis]|uniref:NACHT domain-containing protein n=1 Tax=Streptomyces longwoodensis TaxID=68231 RepID=UPI002DDC71ED|nr:NACHT domain-containing protein [Streptomyces longwoodensis]WRY92831.1 NACHT domain-containing protein [Streptomyces longwoodensis]WUC55628.1 NACHT domain-containing protein [Streptomyces longwoodensis]WUC62253.1 NACHT domain-containing protein [Streptomyces longwoodensis]